MPKSSSALPTIFLIRHGEKPTDTEQGVKHDGEASPDALIPRGWQRAGALVGLFGACGGGAPVAPLLRPAAIFAASPKATGADPDEKSKREKETAGPLAKRLGIALDLTYGKGEEAELAKAVRTLEGPVLIVWEHERIVPLTRMLSSSKDIPQAWPSDRFDVVFILTPTASGYSFSQMPQRLLAGDLDSVIE